MNPYLVDPQTNESVFTFLSEFYQPWEGQAVIEVVFLALIFVFGITGNSMVLAAVCRNVKLRTVTNLLICNLAVTDMLFASGIPFIAVTRVTQHWVFGDVGCKFVTYLQFLSGVCSILTMVAISIERFLCVCVVTRPKPSNREITLVLAIVWSIASGFPVPVALAQTEQTISEQTNETNSDKFVFCGVSWPSEFHVEIYLGFMAACFFFLPLCLISGLYLKILRVVRSSVQRNRDATNNSEKSARKQVRLVKMCSCIVMAFVVMWLPFFVISFLGVHFKQITSTHFTLALILALANTCQNPLIYGYFNHHFREEFKIMFCKRCGKGESGHSNNGAEGTDMGSMDQNSSEVV